MTMRQRTHVDLPWATWHPWLALTVARVHHERLTGSVSVCAHAASGSPFAPAPALTLWVDLGRGRVCCWSCWAEYLEQLPDAWVDGRSCDGCLVRDALVTTFAQHRDLPRYVLLAALCERCAPDGPRRRS